MHTISQVIPEQASDVICLGHERLLAETSATHLVCGRCAEQRDNRQRTHLCFHWEFRDQQSMIYVKARCYDMLV